MSKKPILLALSISVFFCLSLWFSANAVRDQVQVLYNLTNFELGLYSNAVLIGFAFFGVISSIFNIPDILKAKTYFVISAFSGAIFNFLAVQSSDFFFFLLFRFLVGCALAGIYPIGMKLTASHFKKNRGFAIGILLSAVITGSGLPYIFNIAGTPNYIDVMILVSILSIVGGIIVFLFVEEGPYTGKQTKFSLDNVKLLLHSKPFLYASVGYFGHMWELYGAWIYVPVVLAISYNHVYSTNQVFFFSLAGFLLFFSGAIGSIIGGKISDKIGRTKFNSIMLIGSGSCAVLFGFFVSNPMLLFLIALIWGLTIVPDSPQYSAMITELVDEELTGTALTIQTAIGFGIALITVFMIPIIEQNFGWENSFFILVLGPVIGLISMLLLRKHPESLKIAQGNR